MTLFAYTFAALAFAIGLTCIRIIQDHTRKARNDTARRQTELDGFVVIPRAEHRYHGDNS